MAFAQLKSRVLVVILGAPLVIVCVLVGKIPFMLLVSLILVLSLWEYFQMAKAKGAFPETNLSILTAVALIWDMYLYAFEHFALILTGYLILIAVLQLRQSQGSQIVNLSTSFFGVGYLGILISYFVGLRELPVVLKVPYGEGGYWTLAILLAIWVGDSVAYFAGSSFGRHKLAPRVSPKKTVEGAIGGFVGMIVMTILGRAVFSLSWSLQDALVIGIICGVVAQLSDLTESQLKRDAGVKDSSNLLPGHGGIFDRFDVLFLTPPVLYFYLRYFSSLS